VSQKKRANFDKL